MTGDCIRHWAAFLLAWVVQANNVLAMGFPPYTRGDWLRAWVGKPIWRNGHYSLRRYGRAAWRRSGTPVYAYMRVYDEREDEWYDLLVANPIRDCGHYAMTDRGIVFRGTSHEKWRQLNC